MEADIELNAVADDSVVRHGTTPPVGHRAAQRSQVLPGGPKVSSAMAEILGTRPTIEAAHAPRPAHRPSTVPVEALAVPPQAIQDTAEQFRGRGREIGHGGQLRGDPAGLATSADDALAILARCVRRGRGSARAGAGRPDAGGRARAARARAAREKRIPAGRTAPRARGRGQRGRGRDHGLGRGQRGRGRERRGGGGWVGGKEAGGGIRAGTRTARPGAGSRAGTRWPRCPARVGGRLGARGAEPLGERAGRRGGRLGRARGRTGRPRSGRRLLRSLRTGRGRTARPDPGGPGAVDRAGDGPLPAAQDRGGPAEVVQLDGRGPAQAGRAMPGPEGRRPARPRIPGWTRRPPSAPPAR